MDQMLKKIPLIAIIGKSGAGKDTFLHYTHQVNPDLLHLAVPSTTRPRRDYEREGYDYHFLSEQEYCSKLIKKDILGASEFRHWFYGTDIQSLSRAKVNIGIFNPAGVESLLEDPRLEILVVYICANGQTRLLRSLNREERPDCAEICRRYLADEKDFANLPFDAIIIDNENLDYHQNNFNLLKCAEISDWICKNMDKKD